MVVAYSTGHSTSVSSASFAPLHYYTKGTPKNNVATVFGDVHPASCMKTKTTAHDKMHQAKQTTTSDSHTLVAVFLYRPAIDRELQLWKHTCIQSDDTEHLTKYGKIKSRYRRSINHTDSLLSICCRNSNRWEPVTMTTPQWQNTSPNYFGWAQHHYSRHPPSWLKHERIWKGYDW